MHEWLQASGTAAPPPSPAGSESSRSSSSSELQQVFASGAEAAMMVPPSARSSRMSRASRHSVTSSLAMEVFGYSRDMTGHVMQMAGQMQAQAQQDQAQSQLNNVLPQAEAQRADAKQRKEMLIQIKIATEQALRKEKAEADEATRKREQLFMDHELKRHKVLVEANTTLQQAKVEGRYGPGNCQPGGHREKGG